MNVLRVLVNNPFKEIFYGKKINILIAFFIFHKSCVKTFLNRLLTNALRALVSMTHIILTT